MRRVIGIDIHRTFGEVMFWENGRLRSAGRVDMTRSGLEGFGRTLGKDDEVVIEATGNAMAVVRVLGPYVGRVIVANPLQVKAIAHARVKTDKIDAGVLASLRAADFLPEIWCDSACNFGSDSILVQAADIFVVAGSGESHIQRSLRMHIRHSLLPRGLIVEHLEIGAAELVAVARSRLPTSSCPVCGRVSARVHSRYERCLADLPAHGRCVRIRLLVRRFRCGSPNCPRQIFAERLDDVIARPWARRSSRLQSIVHYIGLALGGRPGQSLARRLLLPVSKDTLLRVVRRCGTPRFTPPTVIGIDDWAWRRNQRYGTIICDFERRKTIALLPDREPATAQAWFSDQPQIAIVARDRGGGYALAASNALPQATQVADRWHLMENASRAFLEAVRKSMRQIRNAIGATTINPDLLTAAERIQYDGYLRREEANAAILGLAKDGATIKEIVRRTGHSRGLVRKVLRGQRSDVFRVRESSLERHLQWLDEQWVAGQRNGTELWRCLRKQGFRGCLRVVTEWTTRRRQAEKADGGLGRAPSARTITRLMTVGRDRLSKAETVTVATIESGVPLLVEAREIIAAFQAMIRRKSLADLEPWLKWARTSLVASFANGVIKEQAAVAAAITSPWSNGQTEGQITKLKLVKRQMYGRGKLDLLQARVIGPA